MYVAVAVKSCSPSFSFVRSIFMIKHGDRDFLYTYKFDHIIICCLYVLCTSLDAANVAWSIRLLLL